MRKVGIFGGAFNPPTIGHMETVGVVFDHAPDIDEIWVMPCFDHSYGKKMSPAQDRLAMCQLAFQDDSRVKVWDYEIQNECDGAAYKTLNKIFEDGALVSKYSFAWIIGSDNAQGFGNWYRYEDLRDMIEFLVVPRPGSPIVQVPGSMESKHQQHRVVGHHNHFISSTNIRHWIAKGADDAARQWLDPKVFDYIKENKLYAPTAAESQKK